MITKLLPFLIAIRFSISFDLLPKKERMPESFDRIWILSAECTEIFPEPLISVIFS